MWALAAATTPGSGLNCSADTARCFGNIASTTATFTGGNPFTLAWETSTAAGWWPASPKAGTPLSYVAIEGEAIRNNEQQYDVFLSGRTMF